LDDLLIRTLRRLPQSSSSCLNWRSPFSCCGEGSDEVPIQAFFGFSPAGTRKALKGMKGIPSESSFFPFLLLTLLADLPTDPPLHVRSSTPSLFFPSCVCVREPLLATALRRRSIGPGLVKPSLDSREVPPLFGIHPRYEVKNNFIVPFVLSALAPGKERDFPAQSTTSLPISLETFTHWLRILY